MSGFDPFAASSPEAVPIDVYTDAYRVSGKTATRFSRVADIVNQTSGSSSHLAVAEATVSEYADATATVSAMQVLVDLDKVLLVIAAEAAEGAARTEMRIPKRAVRAQVGIPPFRITGTIHVPQGSRPVDGVLNASDRFMPMTEVTIACGAHPELGRTAAAVAFQRARSHIILVTDDELPDELLADVLDSATAERWLQQAREGEGS
ncbi:MAG TPA: hypothetical protein VH987_00810 [Candidatus Limnocylindria bacterium]|jgi:hypothetical protein